MKLTPKERLFCEYYVSCGIASRAAEKAGYSQKTARQIAYDMKQKPHIREYIKYLEDDKLEELGINKRSYMEEYNNIAKSNIKDYYEVIGSQICLNEAGEKHEEPVLRLKYLTELSNEQSSAIKREIYNKDGRVVGYEFYDKTKALSDMLKILSDTEESDEEPGVTLSDIEAMQKIYHGINSLPHIIQGG
jgi:phage terminase small subunit